MNHESLIISTRRPHLSHPDPLGNHTAKLPVGCHRRDRSDSYHGLHRQGTAVYYAHRNAGWLQTRLLLLPMPTFWSRHPSEVSQRSECTSTMRIRHCKAMGCNARMLRAVLNAHCLLIESWFVHLQVSFQLSGKSLAYTSQMLDTSDPQCEGSEGSKV